MLFLNYTRINYFLIIPKKTRPKPTNNCLDPKRTQTNGPTTSKNFPNGYSSTCLRGPGICVYIYIYIHIHTDPSQNNMPSPRKGHAWTPTVCKIMAQQPRKRAQKAIMSRTAGVQICVYIYIQNYKQKTMPHPKRKYKRSEGLTIHQKSEERRRLAAGQAAARHAAGRGATSGGGFRAFGRWLLHGPTCKLMPYPLFLLPCFWLRIL